MKTIWRLIPLILLLAGCQSTRQRIADCKVGDWTAIGHKDGLLGEPANYADRKDFCDDHADKPAAADAAARYTAGWAQGNWDAWYLLGQQDGVQGQQPQFEQRANNDDVRKHKTPLNRPAYDGGWANGNSTYWRNTGQRDGASGQPSTQKEASRANAAAAQLRFDDAAYADGWRAGNRTFWSDAGYSDARSGIPDSEFLNRVTAARRAGVDVQEESYRSAWNAEIVNYWRNLGTQDATSGKEFGTRGREAKENTRYCVPDNAFERGRTNTGMAVEVCAPAVQNQLKHAYVSGQDYEITAVKYRQAVADANDLANRARDARNRLGKLEREIRANQEAKDRPANDEAAKQDRRREQERRELNDYLQRVERQLDDARRWVERHDLQMQRLRREIY